MLVGDDRQLPELEAGGGFAGLADRLGALELREVRRQHAAWDRDALAQLRAGDVAAWAEVYRDRGRIVARPTAPQLRDQLVGDWWQVARTGGLDGALMLAHRRADVRDLNDRARALMHADGRLGDRQLDAAGRQFAAGDRVITTQNDRRLGVANGWRGTVRDIHPDQHSMTVELDNGRSVTLDAGYLDDGHLDHGYAATAHKAQGATVDSVFVLGTGDLYREWGYTALSRHRDHARFYVVSPASAERTLPGLEPEPDQLAERLERALGETRAKHLALDLPGDARPEADLADTIARCDLLHGEADATRAAEARARDELADVEARLRDLLDERGSLGFWQRARRAELDQHISAHQQALEHWRERADQLAQASTLADEQLASFMNQNAHRPVDERASSADPLTPGAPDPTLADTELPPSPTAGVEPPDAAIDLGP